MINYGVYTTNSARASFDAYIEVQPSQAKRDDQIGLNAILITCIIFLVAIIAFICGVGYRKNLS